MSLVLGVLLAAQAADGLSHHWKLDDAASPAADAVGAIHGTWRNGPTRRTEGLPPAFGGVANVSCLRFDGVDDYVALGSDLPLARNLAAVTVAYWANLEAGFTVSGGLSIAVGPPPGSSADSRVSLVIREGGVLRAGVRAADGDAQVNLDAPAGTLVVGTWAHVAAVIDYANDTIRLYKNGAQVAATTAAGFTPTRTSDTNAKNAALGSNDAGGADRHKGLLDDARVYDRALTAAEVRALCTPAAPPTLDAEGGPFQIALAWTAAPDQPTAFNVYRSTSPTSGFTLLAGNVTGTGYVDTTAPIDAPSYYVVTALGVVESAYSPVASSTALLPPPRVNDHEEGLLGDRCSCGASIGSAPWAIALLAIFGLRRRGGVS